MKQSLSIKELLDDAVRRNQMKADHYVGAKDCKFVRTEGGIMLQVADLGTYLPTRHAEMQLLQDLRDDYKKRTGRSLELTSGYWDNLRMEDATNDTNLFLPQANWWLSQNQSRKLVRTYANADGDDILRAWLSNAYRRLDYEEMLEAVMPVLLPMYRAGELEFVSSHIGDTQLYLKFLLTNFKKEIKYAPGHARMHEVVAFGGEIGTSEVGSATLYVRALSVVQWCSNTAVHNEYSKKIRHIGTRVSEADENEFSEETRRARNRATLLEFRDLVQNVMNESTANAIAAKMQGAMNTPVQHAGHAVETLKKNWNLSERQHDSILFYFNSGNWGNSLFGLHSAITRAAEDEPDYEAATEMEARGGALLNLSKTQIKELVTL